MRSFFLATVSAVFLSTSSTLLAEPTVTGHDYSGGSTACSTVRDIEQGKYWEYDPADAYEFGLRIQQYVQRRDLQSLFGLINGELSNGPRRALLKGKSFSEVFSEEWRTRILSQKPECGPVGWRGFMLGNGNIWYQADGNGGFEIFATNNVAISELLPDPRWEHSGKLLLPKCFTDEDAEYPAFSNVDVPPVRLSECYSSGYRSEVELTDGWIGEVLTREQSVENDPLYYRVLRRLPANHCKSLMPNITGDCIDVRLVELFAADRGSIGGFYGSAIYGIVENPANGKGLYMVQLVALGGVNDALNFVDRLEQ